MSLAEAVFCENEAFAFERETFHQKSKENDRIKALEQKLLRKHEVLSELMDEHVKLKKTLGEI